MEKGEGKRVKGWKGGSESGRQREVAEVER